MGFKFRNIRNKSHKEIGPTFLQIRHSVALDWRAVNSTPQEGKINLTITAFKLRASCVRIASPAYCTRHSIGLTNSLSANKSSNITLLDYKLFMAICIVAGYSNVRVYK